MKLLKVCLAAFPFVSQLAVIPFVNRIEPMICGLPFLFFYCIICLPLTSLSLGLLFLIEQKEAKVALDSNTSTGGVSQ